jgi:hypothetical protein
MDKAQVTRMAISDRSHRHQPAEAPARAIIRCAAPMNDGGYRIRKTDNDHLQEPFDQDQTAESLAAQFGNFG